jgi:hypothetical protein
MYGQALIITAIGYEVSKDRLRPDVFFPRIEAWLEDTLKTEDVDMPCDNSIMCLRTGKRHKHTCPMNSHYAGDTCPEGKRFTCSRVHRSAH